MIPDLVTTTQLHPKMSDDGWGDEEAGWTDGAGDTAAATPAAGGEEEEEEKPRGGGDGKCRNCKQVRSPF